MVSSMALSSATRLMSLYRCWVLGGSDSFVFVEGGRERREKEDPKTVADASTVRRPGKCHRGRVRDRIANDRHTDGSPRRNGCTKSGQNLVS